jgi:hypothetical protein
MMDECRRRGGDDLQNQTRDVLVPVASSVLDQETSGHTQELSIYVLVCDAIASYVVRQIGAACHTNRLVVFYTSVTSGNEVELMTPQD